MNEKINFYSCSKINVIKIMERSGNFYKAIRLGYILISILIGCIWHIIASYYLCFYCPSKEIKVVDE